MEKIVDIGDFIVRQIYFGQATRFQRTQFGDIIFSQLDFTYLRCLEILQILNWFELVPLEV